LIKWPLVKILGMQKYWVVAPYLSKENQDELVKILEKTANEFLQKIR